MLRIILFICLLAISICGRTQEGITSKKYCVSFSALVPTGRFSATHVGGLGISFGNGRSRPGLLKIKNLGLAYESGFNFYFGKKETVSSYDYRYENYLQVYAMPGFIYQQKKLILDLEGGIGSSHYAGSWRFNLMAKGGARYLIKDRYAVGAGWFMHKEKKADPLWSAFLKTCYYF